MAPSFTPDDRLRLYWSIAAEEYKTVRDESRQAEINTFTALQWNAVLLAALVAAGFSQWKASAFVVFSVFFCLVPLLATASLYIWIGEAVRMKRAGDYLCFLERKLAMLAADESIRPNLTEWPDAKRNIESGLRLMTSRLTLADPLNWERWLRQTRPPLRQLSSSGHQLPTYLARLAFFPAISLLSLLVGTYYYNRVEVGMPFSLSPLWLKVGVWLSWASVIGALTLAARMSWVQLYRPPTNVGDL